MAYEVKPWKEKGCVVKVKISKLSKREPSSREINEKYGEGGGLNANYTTVDAAIEAANLLGYFRLRNRKDFVFKTSGLDEIIFDCKDKHTKKMVEEVFKVIKGDESQKGFKEDGS